jgi:glycosyltransferase involved in cell wall biosynthesis
MPIGITVVIPSFNQGEFIADSLQSITAQNYPEIQIIVQDGGSKDATLDVLRRHQGKIEWTSEPDEGQSDAIVKGFAKAKYDWITWLNSDDLQTDNALWKVDAAVSKHSDADVVVGNGHYIDRAGKFLRPYPRIDLSAGIDVKHQMFEGGYLAQPSVFFRRAKYDAVGGIDKSLKFCMDFDLWCRFALAGQKFITVEEDISGNRWYDETKTSSQHLNLLAEVCATQTRLFGKVSFYYAQGLSDALFQTIRGVHHGPTHGLLYRTLFFKSVWIWLNLHDLDWLRTGLMDRNIARSGPIHRDEIDNAAWVNEAKEFVDPKKIREILKRLYRLVPKKWRDTLPRVPRAG